MPKVRRQNIPPTLLEHLRDRVEQREISLDQLRQLLLWLDTHPVVPPGRWFKRFPALVVCGEGELIKTFLREGQVAFGDEVF
jgi:hypothetical protein